jgi:hypothetical protein
MEFERGVLCEKGAVKKKVNFFFQYHRQLRKAEGGLHGMNTAQASNLVENLGE